MTFKDLVRSVKYSEDDRDERISLSDDEIAREAGAFEVINGRICIDTAILSDYFEAE